MKNNKIIKIIIAIMLAIMTIAVIAVACDTPEEIGFVTISAGNGDEYISYEVEIGDLLTEPATPVKEHYKFVGWYSDGKLWDFKNDVVEYYDTILSAEWLEDERATVTFDANGGTMNSSSEETVLEDVYVGETIREERALKIGYEVDGWYYGDELWDFENDIVEMDMTLVAKWIGHPPYSTETYLYEGVTYGYMKESKSYKVIDYEDSHAENVIVLSEITLRGIVYPVTEIATYAFNHSDIESVILPDSIVSIGNNAFWNCYALQEIIIPDSVLSIGEDAFENCYALQEIIIPNSVINIGTGVFSGCVSLSKVVLPNSLTVIVENLFFNCASLSTIDIPEGVVSIGEYAFNGCKALETIKMPQSMREIGDSAFNFAGLQSISLNDELVSIGLCAFQSNSNLIEITIPESVINIGMSFISTNKTATIYVERKEALDTWISFYYDKIIWDCNNNNVDKDGYEYAVINNIDYRLKDGRANVVGISNMDGSTVINEIIIPKEITFNNQSYEVVSVHYIGNKFVKITIPSTIEYIRSIHNVDVIYAEAKSAPDGWKDDWNDYGIPVVWDCKNNTFDEDGYEYTIIDEFAYKIKDNMATVLKCKNASNLIIPKEITFNNQSCAVVSISEYALSANSIMISLYIPDSIVRIEGKLGIGWGTAIREIIIPDSVEFLPEAVFDTVSHNVDIYVQATIPDGWHVDWSKGFDGDIIYI